MVSALDKKKDTKVAVKKVRAREIGDFDKPCSRVLGVRVGQASKIPPNDHNRKPPPASVKLQLPTTQRLFPLGREDKPAFGGIICVRGYFHCHRYYYACCADLCLLRI